MLKITVRYIDGSIQDFEQPESLMKDLIELRRSGYEGKNLVHALLTDDWGRPLIGVQIEGKRADDTVVDEWIPYT